MSRSLIIAAALLVQGGWPGPSGEENRGVPDRGESGSTSAEAATPEWSSNLAANHLDERIKAWFAFAGADRGTGKDKVSCLSCHSVVPYFLARPVLRQLTGAQSATPY